MPMYFKNNKILSNTSWDDRLNPYGYPVKEQRTRNRRRNRNQRPLINQIISWFESILKKNDPDLYNDALTRLLKCIRDLQRNITSSVSNGNFDRYVTRQFQEIRRIPGAINDPNVQWERLLKREIWHNRKYAKCMDFITYREILNTIVRNNYQLFLTYIEQQENRDILDRIYAQLTLIKRQLKIWRDRWNSDNRVQSICML